jgi:cytochrome c peroxidase
MKASIFKASVFSVFIVLLSTNLAWANEFSVNEFLVTDEDFPQQTHQKENLGKFLFFDKILSGNKNISCATCHHPFAATGDGLSLPVGEGGVGLGVIRDTGSGEAAIQERVPRNSPHLFNLGAFEFTQLFHDGRVAIDDTQLSGFLSPAGDDLPLGLDNPLAVQAMFPVTSATEMAGQAGENPIANAPTVGGVWEQLANRLQAIDEYVELFIAAFPDITMAEDITYVHAANAIAAFEASAWQCTNSPFDQYMNGSRGAISRQAIRGGKLFYGKARCATCHSGKFQTNHQYHAIGIPQIGPGKGDNLAGYTDGHDDFGRERVTGEAADRFKFRTPSLRQVALTGPWGHDGAYNDLEMMVRHHLNPIEALNGYDTSQAVMPSREDLDMIDFVVHTDMFRRQAIIDAIEIKQKNLSDKKISYLMAFLYALTDVNCIDLRKDTVNRVPSGLSVAD